MEVKRKDRRGERRKGEKKRQMYSTIKTMKKSWFVLCVRVFVCMGVCTFVCVLCACVCMHMTVYMFTHVHMCKSSQMFKMGIVTICDPRKYPHCCILKCLVLILFYFYIWILGIISYRLITSPGWIRFCSCPTGRGRD